jgi:hypothetical protein
MIGTTALMESEERFEYPSITICIAMDRNFMGNNTFWIDPAKYNFSFPYAEMGVIRDKYYAKKL